MSISNPKPLGRYSELTLHVHESSGVTYWVQTYANRFVKWDVVSGPGSLTAIDDFSDAGGIACAKYLPGAASSGLSPVLRARVHA